jgi:hypothetical protein
MKYAVLFSTIAAIGIGAAAHAETPANLAQQHIDAIGVGDVAKIASQYSAGAWLNWVGGPLDGTYIGPQQIAEVWGKFSKSQAPLKATVKNMAESANPAGSTITADVIFTGKATIKVRYVMLYRKGELVDETWQIDPKLAE